MKIKKSKDILAEYDELSVREREIGERKAEIKAAVERAGGKLVTAFGVGSLDERERRALAGIATIEESHPKVLEQLKKLKLVSTVKYSVLSIKRKAA